MMFARPPIPGSSVCTGALLLVGMVVEIAPVIIVIPEFMALSNGSSAAAPDDELLVELPDAVKVPEDERPVDDSDADDVSVRLMIVAFVIVVGTPVGRFGVLLGILVFNRVPADVGASPPSPFAILSAIFCTGFVELLEAAEVEPDEEIELSEVAGELGLTTLGTLVFIRDPPVGRLTPPSPVPTLLARSCKGFDNVVVEADEDVTLLEVAVVLGPTMLSVLVFVKDTPVGRLMPPSPFPIPLARSCAGFEVVVDIVEVIDVAVVEADEEVELFEVAVVLESTMLGVLVLVEEAPVGGLMPPSPFPTLLARSCTGFDVVVDVVIGIVDITSDEEVVLSEVAVVFGSVMLGVLVVEEDPPVGRPSPPSPFPILSARFCTGFDVVVVVAEDDELAALLVVLVAVVLGLTVLEELKVDDDPVVGRLSPPSPLPILLTRVCTEFERLLDVVAADDDDVAIVLLVVDVLEVVAGLDVDVTVGTVGSVCKTVSGLTLDALVLLLVLLLCACAAGALELVDVVELVVVLEESGLFTGGIFVSTLFGLLVGVVVLCDVVEGAVVGVVLVEEVDVGGKVITVGVEGDAARGVVVGVESAVVGGIDRGVVASVDKGVVGAVVGGVIGAVVGTVVEGAAGAVVEGVVGAAIVGVLNTAGEVLVDTAGAVTAAGIEGLTGRLTSVVVTTAGTPSACITLKRVRAARVARISMIDVLLRRAMSPASHYIPSRHH